MSTLTSPRVNKTPKKKLEEGSSLSTSTKDGDNPEPDPSSSSKSEHTGKKNSTQTSACSVVPYRNIVLELDFCKNQITN